MDLSEKACLKVAPVFSLLLFVLQNWVAALTVTPLMLAWASTDRQLLTVWTDIWLMEAWQVRMAVMELT